MDARRRAATAEQNVQMCDGISNMLKAAVDKVEAFKQEASATAVQVGERGIWHVLEWIYGTVIFMGLRPGCVHFGTVRTVWLGRCRLPRAPSKHAFL
jgi:hypothetical protein